MATSVVHYFPCVVFQWAIDGDGDRDIITTWTSVLKYSCASIDGLKEQVLYYNNNHNYTMCGLLLYLHYLD